MRPQHFRMLLTHKETAMYDPRLSSTVAYEHVRDLRRQACLSQLVAEATCCKQSSIRTSWRRARRKSS